MVPLVVAALVVAAFVTQGDAPAAAQAAECPRAPRGVSLSWAERPETERRGDVGCRVVEWQRMLNAWVDARAGSPATGLFRVGEDGVFGPLTDAVTRTFQFVQGLPVDGIVGPDTRAAYLSAPALIAAHAGPARHEPFLARGDIGPLVSDWQRELDRWFDRTGRGSEAVAVDGVFGPATERATRAFQTAQRITVDGLVGPETRAALLSAPALVNRVDPQAAAVDDAVPVTPAESETPAAGVCGGSEGDVVSVTLAPDVPTPRCLVVDAHQHLRIVNGAQPASVHLGPFTRELSPGSVVTIDAPFGSYLAPGVHTVRVSLYGDTGPELWLRP
jgi:peptidoglycan hydrolase-like protein with peptidoglycan-binding domain